MQNVTENTTEDSGLDLHRVTHEDGLKKTSIAGRRSHSMEAFIPHSLSGPLLLM